MKLLSTLLFSTLLCINSFAQSYFQTSYGDGEIDYANAVIRTSTGNYCIAATNRLNQANSVDIVLYNLDQDGSLLWSAKMGTDKNDFAWDIIQTPDGGFAITGCTYGGLIDSTTSDIFLLKTDDQGFPVFFQTFGGPGNDQGVEIMNSADGGFYIVGFTYSFGNSAESACAIRTDANGNQIWSTFSGTLPYTAFVSSCFNHNGQIIAVGNTEALSPTVIFEPYISLIDTNGVLLWNKSFSSNYLVDVYEVTPTSDSGFAVVGSADDDNIVVCKFDSSGNILWSKRYGGLDIDIGRSIVECSNGDLVVCGSADIYSGTSDVFQNLIMRLDHNGNILWSNRYGDPSNDAEGISVINGESGTLVSVGSIKSINDVLGETHFIKTNANGNSGCYQVVFPMTDYSISFTPTSGTDTSSAIMTDFMLNPNWQSFSNQFSLYCFNSSVNDLSTRSNSMVYPNPGTGIFRIDAGFSGDHVLEIYNSIGQKVMQKVFGQDIVEIDLTDQLSGLYYFNLDGHSSGKIIKTDK